MRKSQSKILRDVIYRIYEGLSADYRKNVEFKVFYEIEMTKIINEKKLEI